MFIISFFVPYIFSYLSVSLLSSNGKIRSADKHKLSLLIFGSVALIIVLAILKQGLDVSSDTISEYSSSIFYTAASYHYMNEVWDNLPSIYSLGLGGNIIGFNTSITDKIKDYWVISNNNAIIATPSMIPDVYLDFGEIGSYFFYFMLFYYLEKKAFQSMQSFSIKNVLLFVLLCTFCFNTSTTSMNGCLKSFLIGYTLILILNRTILKKHIQ